MATELVKLTYHIELYGEVRAVEAFTFAITAILKNLPEVLSVDKDRTMYKVDLTTDPRGKGVN